MSQLTLCLCCRYTILNCFENKLIFLSFYFHFHDYFLKAPTLFPLTAPNDKMKEVLMRTVEEAKALISKVSIRIKGRSPIDL